MLEVPSPTGLLRFYDIDPQTPSDPPLVGDVTGTVLARDLRKGQY